MNPSRIREVLKEINAATNKRLGQHFLIDGAALNAVVSAAEIQKGDHVLEVGPGLGVLTKVLLESGADLKVIERDRRFAEWLTKQAWAQNLALTMGDALDVDWSQLMGEGPWKFVSNLPYAITSIALRRALWGQNPPTKLVVLVQREVAERAVDPKKTSLLSLMIGLVVSSAKIVRRVPPGAFFPPPKVDSAVLVMEVLSLDERMARWGIDPERVMRYAKQGFAHPRKRLASNLGLKLEAWNQVRGENVDNLHIRAEELSVEDWVELSKKLENLRKTEALTNEADAS
jgi:16S rRNA (adenine1518-N6/adenine1519-N6)-dimethyltransferase